MSTLSDSEVLAEVLREQRAAARRTRGALRSPRPALRVGRWRLVDDGGLLVAVTDAGQRVVLGGAEGDDDGR